MILYFTGTGNSRFVASGLAKELGDELVSINDRLKNKDYSALSSARPYIIVCPIYAWKIPRVVEEFIKKTEFTGMKEIYFVATYESGIGNAVKFVERLCIEKGLVFKGMNMINMPTNYIIMSPCPSKEKIDRLLAAAVPKVKGIAAQIKEGKELSKERVKAFAWLKSGPVNVAFYKLAINGKGFHVTDQCIGCKQCEKICPLNNIHMEGRIPVWGNDCTQCMACISTCKAKAIEYKRNTVGKERYYLDRAFGKEN